MDGLQWMLGAVDWLIGGTANASAVSAAGPLSAVGRHLLSEPLSSSQTTIYIVLCVLLVIFAGCMSGLTVGLLSLGESVPMQSNGRDRASGGWGRWVMHDSL